MLPPHTQSHSPKSSLNGSSKRSIKAVNSSLWQPARKRRIVAFLLVPLLTADRLL